MPWILQVTLEVASKTVNMLHAVTGGRRVHLQFIAALNPFRSAQCVPDS